MSYEHNFWIPEFSLRNSDLPFLASEAAIDIDNYLRIKTQEEKSIQDLAHLIDTLTEGESPRVNLPDNCTVLSYALSGREKFEEYWKGKHINEVTLQTKLIARNLRAFKSLTKEKQEELSNFCVRLSREIAYYQSQYYEN